jgi:hypothetical protein
MNLRCMEYDRIEDRWMWLYEGEAKNLKFSTPYSSIPPNNRPIVLGSFYFRTDDQIYLDVGSVERALQVVRFFDRHIKRTVAEVEYVATYNKVFSNVDEHPGHCFDHLFSDICPEDIGLTVENKIENMRKSIEEGRISDVIDDRNFELVETFPAHFYEDGIQHLGTLLTARQAVAIMRWSGNADYCMSDFIKDAMKRMSVSEMN